MQEYDRVRLIVGKEKYARYGVHKGMDGFWKNKRPTGQRIKNPRRLLIKLQRI